MSAEKSGLETLQSELLSLQGRYGRRVKLKKSTIKSSSRAPFPITVTAEVTAPDSASAFDVTSLVVRLRLGPGILSRDAGAQVGDPGLEVELANQELPDVLKQEVSRRLVQSWLRARETAGGAELLLHEVFDAARRDFATLLGSVPSMLEPYESVDEGGATVRRYAIVDVRANAVASETDVDPTQKGPSERGDASHQGLEIASNASRDDCDATGQPRQEATTAGFQSLPEAMSRELNMAGRRYPNSFHWSHCRQVGGLSPKVQFSVVLIPSDPDWDAGELAFEGELWMDAQEQLSVSVKLRPGYLPPLVSSQVDRALQSEASEAHGRVNALRWMLKFMENHSGRLVHATTLRPRETGARSPEMGKSGKVPSKPSGVGTESRGDFCASPSPSPAEARAGTPAPSSSESADAADYSAGSGSNYHDEDEVPGCRFSSHAAASSSATATLKSLSLQLEGLELSGIDVVEGMQLPIEVHCGRCKSSNSLVISSPAVSQGTSDSRSNTWGCSIDCFNCHQHLALELQPRLVHEHSNVLGWLIPTGCAPVDLLTSQMMCQCGGCNALTSIKNVQVGQRAGKQCPKCGTAIMVRYETVSFNPQTNLHAPSRPHKVQSRGSSAGASSSKAASYQGFFKVGQPLPARGTCKHYRHSHRWLRFRCCGKRFPCDLCHEELTDGHEMKWATRMVCGFCSQEQALGERCRRCGKKLAATAALPSGRPSSFWEGGKGCRDIKRMSKNDPRKWRNSKAKTKSKKENRVGQKGSQSHQG